MFAYYHHFFYFLFSPNLKIEYIRAKSHNPSCPNNRTKANSFISYNDIPIFLLNNKAIILKKIFATSCLLSYGQ